MKPSDLRRQIVERCAAARIHHAVWDEGRGSNVLVRAAVDLDNLPEQFGIYLIEPGASTTRFMVIDLDNHGDPALEWEDVVELARPITKHLRAIGHSPMAFRSRGGLGIHIILTWDEDQDAARVRALGTSVIEACGHEVGDGGLEKNEVELFPKQDSVPEDGVGNCIDVPLAGEGAPLDPKTLAMLADPLPIVTSMPLDLFATEVEKKDNERTPNGWDESVLENALACIPADDYGDWITVLRAMKGAAARRQLKLTDKKARDITEAWSKRSSKHTHREFDYKWTKGCRRDANGRGRSLGSLFWLARQKGWEPPEPPCCIDKIRIIDSDPTLFLVSIVGHEGREVTMIGDELNSKQKFQNRVINDIRRKVKYPSDNDINRLLESAEIVPADDDATKLGQFKSRVSRFLDEFMQDDRAALALELKVWRDESSNRTWFKSEDFFSWLKRDRIYDYRSSAEVLNLVRALGGDTGVVNLGKSADGKRDYGSKRCWWVPINPRVQIIELDELAAPDEVETPF